MNNILFFWVGFALIMLFAELIIPGLLYCVSFALGAFAAACAQWLGLGLVAHVATFLSVSLVAVVVLHNLVKNATQGAEHVSNVHALIGKQAIVECVIQPHQRGVIRIDGQKWSARSEGQEFLAAGTIVKIVKIIGCHAIVTSKQK